MKYLVGGCGAGTEGGGCGGGCGAGTEGGGACTDSADLANDVGSFLTKSALLCFLRARAWGGGGGRMEGGREGASEGERSLFLLNFEPWTEW